MVYKIGLQTFVVAAVLLVTTRGKLTTTEKYDHYATLRAELIELYWKYNDTHITFEVHGATTGWIGLGISPNGAMTGSDIYVGWVKNGEVMVTDRHGVGNRFPPLDENQNVDILDGAECEGWTMLKFSRQLAACEPEVDTEITQNTLKLIWAFGDEDPSGDDIEPRHYHGTRRGVMSAALIQQEEPLGDLPSGSTYKTFDIRFDQFAVPAVGTYYNCKIFKMPNFGKRHHIVKYEPIITEGSRAHVHHMDIYRCGDVMEDPAELGIDVQCSTSTIHHFKTCNVMIASWSVGGEATYFPENAGYSVGGEGDPVYVQIELHYDNPTRKSGVIDSSGMRFTYTEDLREDEVGIVQLGTIYKEAEYFVPPDADNFVSIGHCSSDCLQSRMAVSGVEEIKIFGVVLHAHLSGRSLKLKHLRNGVELPPPSYEDHYNFNYQQAKYLSSHITLKPEDHLQVECSYSTKGRQNITEGGWGTRDEMCFAFIAYYPKIDLGLCVSSVKHKDMIKFFGIHSGTEMIPESSRMKFSSWKISVENRSTTLREYLDEFAWTRENMKEFESYYNSAQHYQICLPSDSAEMTIENFDLPNNTSPYVDQMNVCVDPYRTKLQHGVTKQCDRSSGIRHRLEFLLLLLSIAEIAVFCIN